VLFDTHALDGPLFDPRYFVYYEDLDTFWRAQLSRRSTVYNPRSLVRHVHGGSAGEESPLFRYHVERNRTLTSLRNGDVFLAATAAVGLALRAARALAKWLTGRERRPMAWATVRAFAGYLLLAPAVLAERAATREGL
jgi:GT2 family glycosyltransferase